MMRGRFWFPIKGLLPLFIIFVTVLYFFLKAFDPEIPRNEAEWGPKKPKAKKIFWMRIIEKHLNPK